MPPQLYVGHMQNGSQMKNRLINWQEGRGGDVKVRAVKKERQK